MLRTYKYRLYPTKEQSILINKHIGSCRFVYNLALETKNSAYATHRKKLSCFDLMNQLPDLKNECDWLREIDSQSLQQSIINLDRAFTAFFKGQNKFPKFKSKKDAQSFRCPAGNRIYIKDNKLYQPKFQEGINIVIDRMFTGKFNSSTIRKTPTNKYFVSILVETKETIPTTKKPIKENTTVGIDLGINSYLVTSDNEIIDNPKFLRNSITHLKYLQRHSSKKVKGSKNQKKAYYKVALQHEKITNRRRDFLHKLSTQLVKNHDTLCFV